MELEVRVARLGAQGDGVADGPDGHLFVPFALVGECVKVEATPGSDRAVLIDVLERSSDRVAPVCPHCGCRIIGHGVEHEDTIYCCVHCARREGVTGLRDRD